MLIHKSFKSPLFLELLSQLGYFKDIPKLELLKPFSSPQLYKFCVLGRSYKYTYLGALGSSTRPYNLLSFLARFHSRMKKIYFVAEWLCQDKCWNLDGIWPESGYLDGRVYGALGIILLKMCCGKILGTRWIVNWALFLLTVCTTVSSDGLLLFKPWIDTILDGFWWNKALFGDPRLQLSLSPYFSSSE